MTESLRSFTDAAADAVARAIAGVQREAQRERELRDAQFAARMAELETRIASAAEIERRLAERIASVKDGEPGRDGVDGQNGTNGVDGNDGSSVTMADVEPLLISEAERVAAETTERILATWERPQDGKSVTVDELAPLVEESVLRAVSAIPAPKDGTDGKDGRDGVDGSNGADGRDGADGIAGVDGTNGNDGADGKDADPELISDMVQRAVDALPPAQPGKDADPELVASLVDEKVRAAVAALPAPEKGEKGDAGPVGSLPALIGWEDRVHYQGDVVSFEGALYQAERDTGRAPPHEDWACIVRAGRDGMSFTVRGTWSEAEEYRALDVVALNGASFAARRDNPGACPGDGWQLIAGQGKQGKPGDRGPSGAGLRGEPGPALVAAHINEDGLLRLTNGDGSVVDCDLYPVLSKL
jgi:hypothetical protein